MFISFYADAKHPRWKLGVLETASRDTQALNLSRNVSKFYARQVVSDDRAAKPKFVALKSTRSLLFGTTSLLPVRYQSMEIDDRKIDQW